MCTVHFEPTTTYLTSLSDAARLLKLLVVVHKGLSSTADTLFLLSYHCHLFTLFVLIRKVHRGTCVNDEQHEVCKYNRETTQCVQYCSVQRALCSVQRELCSAACSDLTLTLTLTRT
jgi:hypothetical protein